MRLVIAIGGNALLERGEVPAASAQREHVAVAAGPIAQLASDHEILITHGNGPQVGLLASESQQDPVLVVPYPLDIIGAQTQGMIGYLLLQALSNLLPDRVIVSLITRTLVDVNDPAFAAPTKFVGPTLTPKEAGAVASSYGWAVAHDGPHWRRVVPSPRPTRVLELSAIRSLINDDTIVICAGGGGIPVTSRTDGSLGGAEAVIDKDQTASLLAEELAADALLLLTDVSCVMDGFGTTRARAIRHTTPDQLDAIDFPSGSMGPKVDAACDFVRATGKPAMIGALGDAVELLAGTRGTTVTT